MENFRKEKEQYLKDKEEFELKKIAWARIHTEKAEYIKKQLEDLIKYQTTLNSATKNSNSEISNTIDTQKQKNISQLKQEIENLKYEYNSKLSEFGNQRKILRREKDDFEKYKINTRNSIQQQKTEFDKICYNLIEKKSEINQKNLYFNENYLNIKYKDYDKVKKMIIDQNNKNKNDEIGLLKAENELQICQNELNRKENIVENEYKKILEQKELIENDKAVINEDKQIINDMQAEFDNKIRYFENLKKNSILNEINNKLANGGKNINYNIGKLKSEKKLENNGDYLNYEQMNNNIEDSFNAEQYLLGVKNRIESNKIKMDVQHGFNRFDTVKEQEYLKKSNDILDKLKK